MGGGGEARWGGISGIGEGLKPVGNTRGLLWPRAVGRRCPAGLERRKSPWHPKAAYLRCRETAGSSVTVETDLSQGNAGPGHDGPRRPAFVWEGFMSDCPVGSLPVSECVRCHTGCPLAGQV